MHLTFHPSDIKFNENLAQLRQAVIRDRPHAPCSMIIVINGFAITIGTAHVRLDGWMAYSGDYGEHRVKLECVGEVTAYFE